MNILLPSDVFPPKCGGAGWSSHALAQALIARGHTVTAIVPRLQAAGVAREDVLGVPTVRFGYHAPNLPFVQNYFRHERLWPQFARVIAVALSPQPSALSPQPSALIHAQHVQAAGAAVIAGRHLGLPVVVTVRDHWPWDYFATGLHGNQVPYSGQTWAALATDLVARTGPLRGAVAMPAIPYMLGHLRRRQHILRQADAVIAVSSYIAQRLRTLVPPERIHVIPNMVNIAGIAQTIAQPQKSVSGPYVLFVGKLDRNKGAHLLIDIFQQFRLLGQWASDRRQQPTLVFAGDGPLKPLLERELATLGVSTRFLEWIEHDEVLRLIAGCELLLFPSAWGEPLSRVWLEAAACGAPMLAMPTGGIHDLIHDGENGVLAATPELFARRMAILLGDPATRRRLGAAAQATAQARFSTSHVIGQIEQLYQSLV
ncbi:MAG: glycosyltransferase family 4 protein [Roseiflexaceae bacterium]|nr:glycosyltransferase family 4 protein [Roseiflexaceae bacterium]